MASGSLAWTSFGDGDKLTKLSGRALELATSGDVGRKSGKGWERAASAFDEKRFDGSQAQLISIPKDGVGNLLAVYVRSVGRA